MIMRLLWLFFWVILLNGCQITSSKDKEDLPVARVHDKYLYQSDLQGIVSSAGLAGDSADIAEGYVNKWIKRQLLFQKAEDEVRVGLNDIENRVEEYKYQLILYAFQKQYIQDNLDTIVRQDEIQNYYEQHIESFNLKQNIVRGKFVKILFKDPKKDEVIAWMQSKKDEDVQKLKAHCIMQADQYVLDTQKWIDADQISRNTPFADFASETNIRSKRLIIRQDASYIYMLRVDEYKLKGEVSPVNYTKEMIVDIIISKRKVELKEMLQQQIFSEANRKQDYEIYR